jgi:hypothetical protein
MFINKLFSVGVCIAFGILIALGANLYMDSSYTISLPDKTPCKDEITTESQRCKDNRKSNGLVIMGTAGGGLLFAIILLFTCG